VGHAARPRVPLSPAQRHSFAPLCPDAVFEVASTTDTPGVLRAKMLADLANGARLAVLIDPERRTVEVYEQGAAPRMLERPESVALDPVLEGFVLDLAPLCS
jgi:Uma2 family endonuclease